MATYIWYDRRAVASEEVQFFHESRVKHADKEFGTNMELDGMFPRDVAVSRIVVRFEPQVLYAGTAGDTGKLDEIKTFLRSAVLVLQVGTGPMMFIPLNDAIGTVGINGFGQYSLATAADRTLISATVNKLGGEEGLKIAFTIPANTLFKCFLKQKAPAVDIGTVEICLYEGA